MISPDATSSVHDVQPWVIIQDQSPACWRLEDGRSAICLFSEQSRATDYAESSLERGVEIIQPEPELFIRILIECVGAGLEVAALDPGAETARRLFVLRDVLSRIREDLRSGRSPSWS